MVAAGQGQPACARTARCWGGGRSGPARLLLSVGSASGQGQPAYACAAASCGLPASRGLPLAPVHDRWLPGHAHTAWTRPPGGGRPSQNKSNEGRRSAVVRVLSTGQGVALVVAAMVEAAAPAWGIGFSPLRPDPEPLGLGTTRTVVGHRHQAVAGGGR